jgi:hypothetical protein
LLFINGSKEAEYPHPFLCKSNDMEGTTPWLDAQVVVCVFLKSHHADHGSPLHLRDKNLNEK